MKRSEIKEGSTYDNGSKGKWNTQRTVDKVDGDEVHYSVTVGRDLGKKGKMKKASLAIWDSA
ncbi:hypothetical protein ACFFSY_29545 [Paenibacillus aurantiacus]|uniref:Uncharacterized protein n=1 Tax=Paenibacillus aurantiacus TaxID=1936118 RepID=A0ABV5L0V7_9BACL